MPAKEFAFEPMQMPRPLAGVKVLDLSRVLAGPGPGRFWPTTAPTC